MYENNDEIVLNDLQDNDTFEPLLLIGTLLRKLGGFVVVTEEELAKTAKATLIYSTNWDSIILKLGEGTDEA
jgi:hypothetical protein